MHEYEVEKKMKKVKNVILYSRIGSDKYGTHNLDVQEEIMFEFAEKNKLSVVDAVREVADGYLGRYSRPGLLYAVETARLKVKRCAVLVTDIGKFSKRASLVLEGMETPNATFISVKNGLYYKTMPMQLEAAMNEDSYRTKCEMQGRELVTDTLEGRTRYARLMKPMLVDMLNSGLTLEDVHERLGIGSRWGVPSISGGWWSKEQIEDVMNLG